jgi:hypothetical protein
MQAAIDRIMQSYDLLTTLPPDARAEARVKVTRYVKMLFEAGERDPHRLALFGLAYLRELDGRSNALKAGYTGL